MPFIIIELTCAPNLEFIWGQYNLLFPTKLTDHLEGGKGKRKITQRKIIIIIVIRFRAHTRTRWQSREFDALVDDENTASNAYSYSHMMAYASPHKYTDKWHV